MNSDSTDPVRKEYSALAADYDRRWRGYVRASTRETLRRMEIPPDAAILDVGCGTGVLLKELARSRPDVRLHGADPTEAMIEVAAGRLGDAATLQVAYAEALPYADVSFDVVVTTSTFHFFRDPARALAEMRRVLGPRGRLVITDWCDDFLACRICDLALRVLDRAHQRVYDTSECAALLREAGFADLEVESYRIGWLWGLMTATAQRAAEPGV